MKEVRHRDSMKRTNYTLRLALRISNRTRTIHVVRPSALSPGRNVVSNRRHGGGHHEGTPVTPVTPAPTARARFLTTPISESFP
jgi:hypothetical protein